MTVRTWFTISVVCVIALFAAVALKLTAPVNAPSILARVGEIRLSGQRNAACWPDGKKTKCVGRTSAAAAVTVPAKGVLRVVVAYPLQPTPKQGSIEVRRGDNVVIKRDWHENTSYDLAPGTYELVAYAAYRPNAHVRYTFRFRTR
jgi:hypothetical protein